MFQEGNSSAVVLSIASRKKIFIKMFSELQTNEWPQLQKLTFGSTTSAFPSSLSSCATGILCGSSCSVSITGSDFFFLIQFTFIISPFPPQLKGVKHGFINEILMYIKATSGTFSLRGLDGFGLKIHRTAATCGNQSQAQKITDIAFQGCGQCVNTIRPLPVLLQEKEIYNLNSCWAPHLLRKIPFIVWL